ncbi:MAG: response regulator [Leptospira sp.]|nr:response regulator [Leptospira sp.]
MQVVLAIGHDTAAFNELENNFQGHRLRVVITDLNKRLIDYIKSADPDIIIINLSLKNSKEFEFVIQMKKDPFTESIPILALLSREDENFLYNYKILGFSDFMVKPYNKEDLIEKVKNIIKEYTNYKKAKSDSIDSHIEILSHGTDTIIYLRSSLGIYVANEIKDVLSTTMLQRLRDDTICIDIRGLFDIVKSELPILERILHLFDNKSVNIVAGKYFSLLLEEGVARERDNIFMTPEEYSQFLIENKTR